MLLAGVPVPLTHELCHLLHAGESIIKKVYIGTAKVVQYGLAFSEGLSVTAATAAAQCIITAGVAFWADQL